MDEKEDGTNVGMAQGSELKGGKGEGVGGAEGEGANEGNLSKE